MTSFAYDVINPCDFTGFPAKYGLILNSKNVYPPTSILHSPSLQFVLPQDKQEHATPNE